MSHCYSIDTKIVSQTTEETIKKILINGLELGCSYYQQTKSFTMEPININDAAKLIFNNLQNKFDMPSVYTRFLDTEFFILFRPSEEKKLWISLSPSAYIWTLENEHGFDTVDFARYLKIMADLCKNCVIEEIRVSVI